VGGSELKVEVEAAPKLSLAMVENSVPFIARISVTNNGSTIVENLVLEGALLPNLSANGRRTSQRSRPAARST
jgi:hypothetical protein